jgi:haloalkane dehalogenase
MNVAGVPHWLDRQAWPFAPRWLELGAGRLHYVDEGSGRPLVLVHGTPTWSFDWRHTIAALRGERRVLAIDHLGFGLSERPRQADYSPQAHAGRFAEAIAQLVPEGPLDLVVHDFGGPIALDWALANPRRVAHLGLVNTWAWSFADDPLMSRRARLASGGLGKFLYRRLNASLRLLTPSAYGNRRLLTPAIHRQLLAVFPDADSRELVLFALAQALLGAGEFYAGLWRRREALREVPLALLWGMRDPAFQAAVLARWLDEFPQARVTRFERAGHWPHEEESENFVRALRAFLAE